MCIVAERRSLSVKSEANELDARDALLDYDERSSDTEASQIQLANSQMNSDSLGYKPLEDITPTGAGYTCQPTGEVSHCPPRRS